MFGSASCILDTTHEIHSISVGGELFVVGVARGVADLYAERSQRRSPMDEGQCKRAGPVVSEGQEGGVDLHYNQSDPSEPNQVSAHQNQNLTQTQLDDGQRVGCDSIEQYSLKGNRDEEEEDGDRKMKGEEDDVIVEEEEKDSVTAPDTPLTDSSSDTGSLVELHPSVSPETTCPISPVAGSPDEPSYSNPEGKTHTSTTEPTTSTTEPTTSTTEPITSTTEPITSTTEPITSTTEPTTSTTEPTGPTSTTEPSTDLLASLQELGECKDHSHLPQSLHQIAEAFVLQEDYERAVCCVQRLYHQRRLHNLTTLQEQWERRCRSDGQGERNSNTDLAAQQLDRLAYICKTHQRPSPGAEKMTPAPSLVSILKRRRSVCVENVCVAPSSALHKHPAKRRVRFKVPDDGFDQDQVGGDSCLLLFLLCLVTVVISLGGTALYCALGNAHSTVCTDFSRNTDFYLAQLHRGMDQLRHWLTPGF
uniref:Consortin, connexin sorting protein n=1 Tax=Salmo trutta TaxID=8032 RepID=A0A674ENQ7_SALTR